MHNLRTISAREIIFTMSNRYAEYDILFPQTGRQFNAGFPDAVVVLPLEAITAVRCVM